MFSHFAYIIPALLFILQKAVRVDCHSFGMLRGGISDPRNKTLMKMFNMIGIGERAGSGIPDIYQVWESEGWSMPVVEESYNPDRTRLSLEFTKKHLIKTNDKNKR